MTVYEAIHRMRQLSAKKQPFSFSYMTYSRTRQSSSGERTVEHALLHKNPKESPNRYQDHMLTYLDTDTGDVHQCWQPLIMTFDHRILDGLGSPSTTDIPSAVP